MSVEEVKKVVRVLHARGTLTDRQYIAAMARLHEMAIDGRVDHVRYFFDMAFGGL